jgi:hypothetical protein
MSKRKTYINNVIPKDVCDYLRGYIPAALEYLHQSWGMNGVDRESFFQQVRKDMPERFWSTWDAVSSDEQRDFFWHLLKVLANKQIIGSYREGKNMRMYCHIAYKDKLANPGKYLNPT